MNDDDANIVSQDDVSALITVTTDLDDDLEADLLDHPNATSSQVVAEGDGDELINALELISQQERQDDDDSQYADTIIIEPGKSNWLWPDFSDLLTQYSDFLMSQILGYIV